MNTRSVRVESGLLHSGSPCVPVVEIDVHAGSQDDAARLAHTLGLGEVEGRVTDSDHYGTSVWRRWRGWVPDESCEAAVSVAVTGADRAAGTAVA
ncbi:MAG: hypothetical protein L0H93_04615 [Nocardioides sp.]|nr:hypothetical protein [Nocardioides sp.]